MTHFTPDELIDAVEGSLEAGRAMHLEQCRSCRHEVARLGATLRGLESVSIPEPSPVFWTHFSQRVHDAIAAETVPRTGRAPAWLQWQVLAPVAALALLVLALVTALPDRDLQQSAPYIAGGSEPADDWASVGEREWLRLAEMVGPMDLETVHDAGLVQLGDVELAALQLSADEQRELLRLLEEEMHKAGG